MNRTLYTIKIKAIKINNDLIRIAVEEDGESYNMWNNVMPKEWEFIRDILGTFTTPDGNQADDIVRIAREYKGYNG